MNFLPTASPENLRRRAELLRALRRFFDDRGFVEVQTPVLSADTLVDRYVEPIGVTDESFPVTPHGTKTRYLQTSPEFAMKRLVAAGMEAVYQIGPVFRRGDRGRLHNVEFTMLEWYRTGQSYREATAFLVELVRAVGFSRSPDIFVQSYETVFRNHTGLDPHRADAGELRRYADKHDISYPDSYVSAAVDDWLDLIFDERVQPHLEAAIVYDYPGSQSQLAKTRTVSDAGGEYPVTERFELFLNGIELANGYHELLDAAELRRRFEKTNENRLADGRSPLPVESRLLRAMQSGLPSCCGTALGVDRLLMALLGADSIDQVLTFPFETA